MMKSKLLVLAMTLVLCFSVSGVQAAYIVDLNPSATTVGFGEIFTIDVVLSITDGDLPLLSAGFDFTYDPVLVGLTAFDLGPQPPVDASLSFLPDTSTAGQINGFGAGTFSDEFADGTVLATMTFAADSMVGLADFGIMASNSTGGWFNTAFSQLDITDASLVTVNGASVNVVPIPGAFLLLGSGLIGLIGLRRKLS